MQRIGREVQGVHVFWSKMDITNANNTVLMQCFEQNGMNGIRLWNSTGVKMTWGIDSANGVAAGSRDMTVIRHIKGDNLVVIVNNRIRII